MINESKDGKWLDSSLLDMYVVLKAFIIKSISSGFSVKKERLLLDIWKESILKMKKSILVDPYFSHLVLF